MMTFSRPSVRFSSFECKDFPYFLQVAPIRHVRPPSRCPSRPLHPCEFLLTIPSEHSIDVWMCTVPSISDFSISRTLMVFDVIVMNAPSRLRGHPWLCAPSRPSPPAASPPRWLVVTSTPPPSTSELEPPPSESLDPEPVSETCSEPSSSATLVTPPSSSSCSRTLFSDSPCLRLWDCSVLPWVS